MFLRTFTPPCSAGLSSVDSRFSSTSLVSCAGWAERPSVDEVLDGIERHSGGRVGLQQAADDLAGERRRH
jgi:hypothetical protein